MATTNAEPGAGTLTRVLWSGLLLAACGCTGPDVTFAPVEGTVTRNGRPVARAQVIFFAEDEHQGPRATGLTDEGGRFRLAADDGRVGAPVGRHRVCVIDTSVTAERFGLVTKQVLRGPSAKVAAPTKAAGKPALPPQYARPAETPLRAEVRPGPQTIDLRIP